MMIGDGYKALEKRMTGALDSRKLRPKEEAFLRNIMRKVDLYREQAFVSDAQAAWLFTILTSSERKAPDRSIAGRHRSCGAHHTQALATGLSIRLCPIEAGLKNAILPKKGNITAFDITEAFGPENNT